MSEQPGWVRRMVYAAVRGPEAARRELVGRLDSPRMLRATLVPLVKEPHTQAHARLHEGLQAVRRLHCSERREHRCVGVMTVDAVGVHLACARCGDTTITPDARACRDALVQAIDCDGCACAECGGLGYYPGGDRCADCDGTGSALPVSLPGLQDGPEEGMGHG